MDKVNIIIDAVIDSNEAINITNELNECLEFIIKDQMAKTPDSSVDIYNSICKKFKLTVENTHCENYPKIEKKIKIIMEAKNDR